MPKEFLFSVTLADCDVQMFPAGGPGGQNANRRSTAVRIVHPPSGARGESREERSQLQNKKTAFTRMTKDPRFRFWIAQERKRIETGKTIEQRVDESMEPPFVQIEVRKNGMWMMESDE